ncbi:MAG: helix-turn-helix domain-containing protein [bacterium]
MFKTICLIVVAAFRSQRQLAFENLTLRHQLEVLQRTVRRPKLTPADRTLFVWISRSLDNWKQHLTIVQPETVIAWHRRGWRLWWRWKSCPKEAGRPRVPWEVIELIRRISAENPTWGAPRIHGEMMMLGYFLSMPA